MRKLVLLTLSLFAFQITFGQLTGIKTVPGDYATIAAAVADLNSQGVGSGGVTFDVAAGHTETVSAPISLTATGTGANQIIFQKSGSGANPLITAYTGTSTPGSAVQDGIWNFVGSDYVTINGIDLFDPNSTNPATMEYGYALFKASADNGCRNNTIKNCVISLSLENNASGSGPSVEGSKGINVVNSTDIAQTTALTPTSPTGANSYNVFYSNTIQKCNYGIVLIGYADVSPFSLADFANDIGGSSSSTGNSIINFGGATGATNPAAGIRTLAQYNLNVSYNTVNSNNGAGVYHVSTLRGIYLNTALSASATVSFNSLSISSGATTSQVSVIENVSGSTAAGNTININNNNILNCSWATATSGTFYGIYNTSNPAILNINNNSFANITRTGTGSVNFIYNSGAAVNQTFNNNIFNNLTVNSTGTVYLLYCGSSLPAGGTQNVNGNSIVTAFSKTGAGGTLYGIYTNSGSPAGVTEIWTNNNFSNITVTGATTVVGIQNTDGGAPAKIISGNIISNITGGTSAVTGINFNYGTADIFNNTLTNITGGGAITAISAGSSSATLQNVYSNNINTIASTGAATVTGIISAASGTSALSKLYKNSIYNLQANNAAGIVYGLSITAGTSVYAYNNYISALLAPSTSNIEAVRGISITSSTATSTVGIYDNTIYLNASSTGANFGSSGIFHTYNATATTASLDMRNNIIINISTPAGTGLTAAFRRSASTSLLNYATTSNNNCFYAGTPSSTRLIYYDGTNSDQTLGAFKSRVSPRESTSVSENPPFVYVASVPYNLHLQTSVPTQCESGAAIVSTPLNIVEDYDGNPRYPNPGYPNNVSFPASAPDIGADEFGGILQDLTSPNIAFTPFNNVAGTGNRTLVSTISDATGVPTSGPGLPVLYWKINSGAYSPVTGVWVSGSTYTFSFGAGVVLGDVVSYYIVAQDLVSPTPNVGVNPSGGASGLTYNPPACSTPPTTPYTYTIVQAISGNLTIGASGNYPSLTGAGGLFADLNSKAVVGSITVQIISDLTEDGTNALNQLAVEPDGSQWTLTIQPDAASMRTIAGSYSGGLIRLNGADRVIFDGRFGGSGSYLTFANNVASGTTSVFQLISTGAGAGATGNTIRNCTIRNGYITSGAYCIVAGGSTVASTGADNDNNTFRENLISKAYVGIWAQGNATSNPGLMENLQVTDNILGSATTTDYLGHDGMIFANASGCSIAQNTVYNIIGTNTTPVGITLSTGFVSSTVSRNKINNIVYTGTGGWGGRGMYINTGNVSSNLIISNNLVYVIGGDGYTGFSASSPVGMYFDGTMGGLNIYYNSVYMSGALTYSGATLSTAILFNSATITGINLRDNIFMNSMDNAAQTTDKNYAIYSTAPASSFTSINYNDYYVAGAQGILGYLGTDQLTLASWQAATGQDANSKNIDPQFVSTTDLHPAATGIDNQGVYIATVITDFNNVARTNPPDMGAYEFGINPTINTLAASNIYCYGGTLNGTINANGLTINSFFDYGTTTDYGSSIAGTPATVTGTSVTPISAEVTLPPSSTYHFRIKGVSSAGVASYGPDMIITTFATGAPVAITIPASAITDTSATMHGTVNGLCNSTSVEFEYGTTTSYGSTAIALQSPVTGNSPVAVDVNVIGLNVNTTYHFRVKATSSLGTTFGEDLVFTTGANPPVVLTNAASNIGNFGARLNGAVTASNQLTTVTFEYGLTSSYGSIVSGVPAIVSGNSPVAVYADISSLAYNTTYHFRVVGQNPAGTTYGTDMVFTTLCPIPDAAGTITGPTSVCQATTGNVYTVPAINYAYNGYVWTVPTGGTITAGNGTNSITVSYSSSAVSGNVTVYGTSICGNGAPSSLPVTINPLPVPVINGPIVACITNTYTYSTAAGMSGYAWTVSSGGQIMTGAGTNTITVKWNSAGAQFVTVTYTSAAGCPAASPTTKNVTVGNLTSPTIAGSDLMCVNSGWHVYTTQQGFSNYVWTVTSGGTIVSGQGTYQVEVNWTAPGAQSVSVNYANTYGCSASVPTSFGVTVMGLPGNAGAITGTHGLCAGTTGVTYSVSPIPNTVDYIWTLPAGATIVAGENTNNITVDFALNAVSGDIRVQGENLCGTGQLSPPYAVTVNPIPPAPVASVDEFFVLHSDAPEGNQWYLNGTLIEGATGQDYQAEEEGTYSTIVTLEDCVSEESNLVEVIFTGLNEPDGTGFSIYPVPNNGKFVASIVIPGEGTFSILVYNDLGVKMYERRDIQVKGKAQQSIDLNNPATGVYTVILQGEDRTVVKKILVTK